MTDFVCCNHECKLKNCEWYEHDWEWDELLPTVPRPRWDEDPCPDYLEATCGITMAVRKLAGGKE